MKKRILTAVLILAFAVSAGACGGSSENTADSKQEAQTAATPEATEAPKATEQPAATGELSEADAKKVALTDAGLSEDSVTWTKANKDYDDDRAAWEWEIEFTSGELKYEYDIDVLTGTITDKDTDSIYDD